MLFYDLNMSYTVKLQIEAIVQDGAGQGSISNIDALNIKLDNQVCQLFCAHCFCTQAYVL